MNGKKPARPHLGGVKAAPTDTSAYAAPGEGRGGTMVGSPWGAGVREPQVMGLGTCPASLWL